MMPGKTFSGVIEKCGKSVKGFNIGDRVFGMLPGMERGTFTQYLVADASTVSVYSH